MINDKTPHLQLPLPHPDNDLAEDIAPMREAFGKVDAALETVAEALAKKADDAHRHPFTDLDGAPKIAPASTTTAGVIRIATAAEVGAGTSTLTAVTPARMSAGLAKKADDAANTTAHEMLTADIATVAGKTTPVGTIVQWPIVNSVPEGFLFCNGGIINKAEYPALYAVIGDSYNIGVVTNDKFMLPHIAKYTELEFGQYVWQDINGAKDVISVDVNQNNGDVWTGSFNSSQGIKVLRQGIGEIWESCSKFNARKIVINQKTNDVWTCSDGISEIKILRGGIGNTWEKTGSGTGSGYGWHCLAINQNNGDVWAGSPGREGTGSLKVLRKGSGIWQDAAAPSLVYEAVAINQTTGDVWVSGAGSYVLRGGVGTNWIAMNTHDSGGYIHRLSINSVTGDVWGTTGANNSIKVLRNGAASWNTIFHDESRKYFFDTIAVNENNNDVFVCSHPLRNVFRHLPVWSHFGRAVSRRAK